MFERGSILAPTIRISGCPTIVPTRDVTPTVKHFPTSVVVHSEFLLRTFSVSRPSIGDDPQAFLDKLSRRMRLEGLVMRSVSVSLSPMTLKPKAVVIVFSHDDFRSQTYETSITFFKKQQRTK